MLPEALSNDACSLVPAPGPARGHGGARLRRARRSRAPRSTARSSAPTRGWTTRAWTASSPARERAEEPWAAPLEAARAVARGARARRAPRAARSPSSRSSRSSTSPTRATSPALVPSAADRVAQADRAPDDRRQRGGRRRSSRRASCRRSTASTSGPSPRASSTWSSSSRRSTCPRRRCPRRMTPQQAGELVGEISRLVDEHVRRTGRGRPALTSLVLRSLKQARYAAAQPRPPRPAVAALLPLHLADPPLPRPDLPPRAAGRRSARARSRPGGVGDGGRGGVVLAARARRGGDRARGRRRRARVPARGPALPRAAGRPSGPAR